MEGVLTSLFLTFYMQMHLKSKLNFEIRKSPFKPITTTHPSPHPYHLQPPFPHLPNLFNNGRYSYLPFLTFYLQMHLKSKLSSLRSLHRRTSRKEMMFISSVTSDRIPDRGASFGFMRQDALTLPLFLSPTISRGTYPPSPIFLFLLPFQ